MKQSGCMRLLQQLVHRDLPRQLWHRAVGHKRAQSNFHRVLDPQVLVIDNGPQYDSAELFAFARSWCFEKVTSSPKLPEGIQGVSSAT